VIKVPLEYVEFMRRVRFRVAIIRIVPGRRTGPRDREDKLGVTLCDAEE
jgi:hypothetical protein